MSYLLFALVFALCLTAGLWLYGTAIQQFKEKKYMMTAVSLAVTAGVTVLVWFFFNFQFTAAALGFAAALFLAVDPFSLTEEKAHAIGKEYKREKALKEQKEEQEREDEMRRAENARVYREAVKELKKHDSGK